MGLTEYLYSCHFEFYQVKVPRVQHAPSRPNYGLSIMNKMICWDFLGCWLICPYTEAYFSGCTVENLYEL
jgi:hypothetical protein